jgi:hypothetical protein
MQKEYTRNGCKTVITEDGLYHHYCSECGRNEKEHIKLYETGYYIKVVFITCKCGSKYSYTA